MRRNIIVFCLVVCLLLTGSCVVSAADLDWDATGSITVTLTEQTQNTPVVGARLSVYYVAFAEANEHGNLSYVFTEDFDHLDIPVNDPSLSGVLDNYLEKHTVAATTITTDATGTAICQNLDLGLYFVKQTGAVDGFAPCTSFLVTVPCEEGDTYLYDVNATPKTEVEKLTSITIKKVWNTDGAVGATSSVTVQLWQGDRVVKTATLTRQNDWQITYTNMPLSDAYHIKEVGIPKGFTATYKQAGNTFTVTNTPTLIQTGQLTWPIPVLAISGMLLVALGVSLLQKKRNAHA